MTGSMVEDRWKMLLSWLCAYGASDAHEAMKVEGSKRQAHRVVASVTEVIVGLCRRESNQPRPGVAPGCPQPMLRAQPGVCGAQSMRSDAATRPSVFVRESEDPAKLPYSRMALGERSPLATAANAESH